MNRQEQLAFAYILLALLRLIAAAIIAGTGFHDKLARDTWQAESFRVSEEEKKFWKMTGVL